MMWMVMRPSDGTVMARFSSKPKALAAALRFGKDGRDYKVVAEPAPPAPAPPAAGILIPLRGH
jgi:hypothetical protein